MRLLVRLFLFLVGALPVCAQDMQNRNVLHVMADVNDRWFVPVWSITNFRSQSPNNTNLFVGAGYRGKNWWLEGMLQRQWNAKAKQLMLDFRFDKRSGPWHLYAEAAPFLTKKAFYEFVIIERQAWKGLLVGGEMENAHQSGQDVISVGPRIGHRLGKLGGFDFSANAAVRFSPVGGHVEPRLYLVLNRRVKLGF